MKRLIGEMFIIWTTFALLLLSMYLILDTAAEMQGRVSGRYAAEYEVVNNQ